MANLINARVSAQVLKFKPGDSPAAFEVTVINDSDQFATFQLEVLAAGADGNQGYRWYSLSPEVSAKKPPGDTTKFTVTILDTPVPGFAGIMNLTVRVFSLQLGEEERQVLRLVVQEGAAAALLKVDLPIREFQAYPGDRIEIPVRLKNPGQQYTDVFLKFLGLEPAWLIEGAERKLPLAPGGQTETTFSCQPSATQSLSKSYPFTIEATSRQGSSARVEGTLVIFPTGFVQLDCTPNQRIIPAERAWFPGQRSETAAPFELVFENESNVATSASVQILGEDQQRCTFQLIPEKAELIPGETSKILLEASAKRPRWGIGQQLSLDVAAVLSDQRLELRKDTQRVELRVLPLIPFWLQLGGGLLALLLLALLLKLWPHEYHKAPVSSVRFTGLVDHVFSASQDQTIRAWSVDNNRLEPHSVFATGNKAVRLIRLRPVDNNLVAAGLENGEIQLWDVLSKKLIKTFSFLSQRDDRVFDLQFTRDSRYLFSAHGSGSVLQWNLERDLADETIKSNKPVRGKQLNFAVYALGLVGNTDTNLVMAGRYNLLGIWNLPSDKIRRLPYRQGGQNDYIESISTADTKRNLMATADNQGYITLWDMSQCLAKDVPCNLLDEWRDGHNGKPVRSVALSNNGCYLTSAGDDGRVMLWPLEENGRRADQDAGRKVAQFSRHINSVAIALVGEDILITSGGDDNQVQLLRVKQNNPACR